MKKIRKKPNRKLLLRKEMWNAICNKYPCLNVFSIESAYTNNSTYRTKKEMK